MVTSINTRTSRTFSLLVVICLFSFPVYAQYSGGTGEPNDPYIIDSEADLLELSSEPNDFSRHFLLTKDLDLVDKYLMPIGWADGNEFTGVFDGNDHTIFNLTLNLPDEDYVGLFGHIGTNGTIRNLGLEGTNIIGKGRVGGLAGKSSQGIVTNCYSKGVINGDSHVGGLVGHNLDSTVSNCYSTAVVNGQSYNAGGLVGLNTRSIVNNSYYSTGTVHGSRLVGGLVGHNFLGGVVINCYASGTVEGNESVGGLVGYADECIVSNCYSLCEATGEKYVGGLIGKNEFSGVDNCYSAGKVTGTSYAGGLIGNNFISHVSNCFWEIGASTKSDSSGGTGVIGLMKVDMQDIDTYRNAGWDFINESENGLHQIWQMSENTGYPVLSIFNGYRPVELPGMGTEQEPYLISTVEQMGVIIHANSNASYQLISDIDSSGINWTMPIFPIFAGVLDGNDQTIHDIKISSGRNAGVFGFLKMDGMIKNLRVYDVNCVGGSAAGGLVGLNKGELINCSLSGEVAGHTYVGTLVGWNEGIVTNCCASGAVEGELSVGGLVGYNSGYNRAGTVSNCYSRAAVIGVIGDVGGLIGLNIAGIVSNCYSMAAVIGGGNVGGLIGSIRSGVVNNCYSVGEVTGDFSLGGLVGIGPEDAVTYSFWDIDTSGLTKSAGGIDSNTADMQKASTFFGAGWDFVDETANGTEDIWFMPENDYPRLTWESTVWFPDYMPLDPNEHGIKTFEWIYGKTGEYISIIGESETVPYLSGPITGVQILGNAEWEMALFSNDGTSVKFLGFEGWYLSTDSILTAHPPVWSFSKVYDGMIIDQGVYYMVDPLQNLSEKDDNKQVLLFTIQDITVPQGNYENAVVIWYLDTEWDFTALNLHGMETDLGLIPPESIITNDSVTHIEIYGFGTGVIAVGDVDAETGSLLDLAVLKQVE